MTTQTPRHFLDAYKDPALAARMWADEQRRLAEDPEAVRAREYAERIAAEQAAQLEQDRERRRQADARKLGPTLDEIEAAEADARQTYPLILEEIRRASPEALIHAAARERLADARSRAAACREVLGTDPAPEETLGIAQLAREEIERRRDDLEQRRAEAQRAEEERLAGWATRRRSVVS